MRSSPSEASRQDRQQQLNMSSSAAGGAQPPTPSSSNDKTLIASSALQQTPPAPAPSTPELTPVLAPIPLPQPVPAAATDRTNSTTKKKKGAGKVLKPLRRLANHRKAKKAENAKNHASSGNMSFDMGQEGEGIEVEITNKDRLLGQSKPLSQDAQQQPNNTGADNNNQTGGAAAAAKKSITAALKRTSSINLNNLQLQGLGLRSSSKDATRGGDSSSEDDALYEREWVVWTLEGYLRVALICVLAYLGGVHYPQFTVPVKRFMEYTVVAWLTCMLLVVMEKYDLGKKNYKLSTPTVPTTSKSASSSPSRSKAKPTAFGTRNRSVSAVSVDDDSSKTEHQRQLQQQQQRVESPKQQAKRDQQATSNSTTMKPSEKAITSSDHQPLPKTPGTPAADYERLNSAERTTSASSELDNEDQSLQFQGENNAVNQLPHESLQPYFLMDTTNGDRVVPNKLSEPYIMDNEYFKGTMLMMIRTPDVDDPSAKRGNDDNNYTVEYMRGKQRRWEIQFQIKLKKLPTGKGVYFACELDEPIKMGIIQRAFVGAAMAFMKSTNSSFHYSMTGSKYDKDGTYEKPHMSFPAEISMDRFVVTKPNETPPVLGQTIYEDPESIKRRKKGIPIDYNLEDTYTLALWTAYVDFLEWKVINLPGIRPFQLTNVIGPQSIRMVLYLIPDEKAGENHYRKDIETVVDLEMSNVNRIPMNQMVKNWLSGNQPTEVGGPMFRTQSEDTQNGDEVLDDDDDDEVDDDDVDVEEDRELEKLQLSGNTELAGTDADVDADADADEESDSDADAATVAELGEGMYLRSGDSVVLKEATDDGNGQNDGETARQFLTNGGGFAILQDGQQELSSAWTITIEKARMSKSSRSRARNELIKSGDTVTIKLISKGTSSSKSGKSGGEEFETKYLSIHRGWWLKWVSSAPTKNGYFSIYTHETEFDATEFNFASSELAPAETQSSYLTVGGTFWLRHKRWSKYRVGVAKVGSATYGGRMLGLFIPKDKDSALEGGEMKMDTNEDYNDEDDNMMDSNSKRKGSWMKPLCLRALEGFNPATLSSDRTLHSRIESDERLLGDETDRGGLGVSLGHRYGGPGGAITFSNEDSNADVPAWVEMMNRKERVRQLAYVIRVLPNDSLQRRDSDSIDSNNGSERLFIRLRTGRDLNHIIKVGLNWKNSSATTPNGMETTQPLSSKKGSGGKSSSKSRDRSPMRNSGRDQRERMDRSPLRSTRSSSDNDGYITPTKPSSPTMGASPTSKIPPILFDSSIDETGDNSHDDEINNNLGDPWMDYYGDADDACESDGPGGIANGAPAAGSKEKGAVKNFAKRIVKTGGTVVKTGGHVGKQVVVGVGKGTVHVGKAIIGKGGGGKVIRAKKQPDNYEPKKKRGAEKARRRRERDFLHVDKTMKRMETSNMFSPQPETVAGELSPPEQSYRAVSNLLSRMSSLPTSSQFFEKFNRILSSQIVDESELDTWFLQGGATQLGVVPPKKDSEGGSLLHECNVARSLWETHWREEWCGVYENCVTFFAPFFKESCLELSFIDIQSVRSAEASNSPLPGFPLLVIETAWLCHYVAFANYDARESFRQKMEDQIQKHKNVGGPDSDQSSEKELWKARFWQGFQNSVESSLSSGRGKWAEVSVGKKMMRRKILNSRRMIHDLDPDLVAKEGGNARFVEKLLSTSLSFSLDSLEKDPKALVNFLDALSHLRSSSLLDVERSSPDAFCLYINLYHCLLQHSLLLAISGPLHRRNFNQFMLTSCYEIGGDVFSLAEINCCIIRGKMSRPVGALKPPYVDTPKKSNAYRVYALDFKDPLVNFIVNTSDVSCPQDVPVLVPSLLEDQLLTAAKSFVKSQLIVDAAKRVIFLPKVCDIYRNDFQSALGAADNTNTSSSASGVACVAFCSRFLDDANRTIVRSLLTDDNFSIKYLSATDQFHSKLVLRATQTQRPSSIYFRSMSLD